MAERELIVRRMTEILEDDTEPDWIVEGILMRGAVTFLTGESGSFKTFLALDLANKLTNTESDRWLAHIIDRKSRSQFQEDAELYQALANAQRQMTPREFEEFAEQVQTDQGAFRVLYVMAESTASAGHRQEAWMQTTRLATSPHFWMLTQSINIATELEWLVDFWEGDEGDLIDVIIVDTFSANTPGVDENSKQSLDPTLQALRRMKERNKAVLVLHHGTKDGKNSYRGHSSIENDTDIRFVTEREGKGEIITLKSDRQKEYEDWLPYQVKVPVVALTDEQGNPRMRRSGERLTSRAVSGTYRAPTATDDLMEFLLDAPNGATVAKLAEVLGEKPNTVSKRLKSLLDENLVERNIDSQPHVYFVTHQVEDL